MIDGIMTDQEFLTEIEYFQSWGNYRRSEEITAKLEQGTARQKYLWALIYYKRSLISNRGDSSQVYEYFEQATDAGHEKSVLYLNILSNGLERGDILNLYKMGNDLYEYSNDKDEEKQAALKNGAFTCWRKSAIRIMELAKKGISPAQILLAEMYLEGKGVPLNSTHAYAWAEIAKINGQPKAREISNLAKEKMTADGILRAETKATDMLEANPELYEDLA